MIAAGTINRNFARGNRARRVQGFTLVEVLCALLLISIAMPPIMQGIQLAQKAASLSKQRDVASGLASMKISQLLADQTWQSGASSGDFSPDFPNVHWQSAVGAWQEDQTSMELQELDVTVTWTQFNRDQTVTLSTIVFPRNTTQ